MDLWTRVGYGEMKEVLSFWIYMFKIEPTRFSDELDMRREKEDYCNDFFI